MDSVGLQHLFLIKSWRQLGGVAIFLGLGCGASAPSDGLGLDPAKVRTVDRNWINGKSIVVAPTPPPLPPGGEIGDTSGVVGHWFVNRGGTRLVLLLEQQSGQLIGSLRPEGSRDVAQLIDHVTWDSEHGQLRFRVEDEGKVFFYAVDVVEGTMTGRYAFALGGRSGPADWASNSGHLMAWRRESFDADLVPRVFDIVIDDGRFVRLRLDRNESDPLVIEGELKVKATTAKGSDGELPAQPIVVRHWDGEQIAFDLPNGTARQRFTGSVKGRHIDGTLVEDRTGLVTNFAGTRANVLSYGLRVRTGESRLAWQERVRRILYHLMMAGNPAPLATVATVAERPLSPADRIGSDRDDDAVNRSPEYGLSDVVFEHTLPNPYGTEPIVRRSHGLLAVPTTPPPAGGYGLVLAVNGHGGSAQLLLDASDPYYWYGDAYARRGYVVLALDISHRPLNETGGIYWDPADGDSPETGNHAHPSIAAPGLDSDWSDDGERVWDAMRAIDFLLTRPSGNPNRIIVTGLSMGAEVTEIVGALDPRVTTVVPAGAPPDLSLMPLHGNHPCWKWTHGDATEFVEMSDYLALTAPRHVVLESGKTDYTYSSYSLPYVVEKENAWRARTAYGDDAANFVHYLHPGGHQYRVGDSSDDSPTPAYIQVPQLIAPPGARPRSIDWKTNGETVSLDQTLFDYLAR
ncbi:MAG TPA: hypothetical protein VK550_11995 [Polyangiaceae bacterium]|nr:hypothetical protein [Polyangiaceae bacterium]